MEKYRCDDPDLDDIEFDSWDSDTLVCKAIGVKPDAIDLEGKCKAENFMRNVDLAIVPDITITFMRMYL